MPTRFIADAFTSGENKIDIYEPNLCNERTNCSLVEYIKGLASLSIFPGVPQIVQVSNHWRKLFKILVLIGCAMGFGYQTYSFTNLYYSYPKTIEMGRKYSNNMPIPKLTFCNRNGFKRKPFCKDHPEFCYAPSNTIEFCSNYPRYCRLTEGENITVLLSDLISIHSSLLMNYSQKPDELFDTLCYSYFPVNRTNVIDELPLLVTAAGGQRRICYSVEYSKMDFKAIDKVESVTNIERIVPCFWWTGQTLGENMLTTILKVQSEEYSRPELEPSIQVSVSTPSSVVNPFTMGFRALPGKLYTIKVKVNEHILLPQPFSTNCTENSDLEDGYSKEKCFEDCKRKEALKQCKCDLMIGITQKETTICRTVEHATCLLTIDYMHCYSSCNEPCNFITYEYDVEEMELANTAMPPPIYNESIFKNESILFQYGLEISKGMNATDKTVICVVFESKEITVLKYKPMFQGIAFLGIIGGYSGIWLGMSLVTILNVVEDAILILHHICYRNDP